MQFQVVLPSGLGLRYRELTPSECDEVLRLAATIVGPREGASGPAVMMELMTVQKIVGVKRMIVAVSKDKIKGNILEYKGEWKKLTVEEIDDKYDKLFNARDHAVMGSLFSKLHDVSEKDVDAILGKALPVSED